MITTFDSVGFENRMMFLSIKLPRNLFIVTFQYPLCFTTTQGGINRGR